MREKIAVLVGPTACGKTALSIEIAKRINASVLSADSVQIYERLDIGSAKPTAQEMQGIAHYMVGTIPVKTPICVAQYQRMAQDCIEQIQAQGKRTLVVGGTGLYINALTTPMDFTQAGANAAYRETLLAISPAQRYEMLEQIDPPTANRLHMNDTKRIVRALEVFYCTGKTITQYNALNAAQSPKYDSILFGLTMERALLYERIERRVDGMMQSGLLEEVQALKRDGLDASLQSLQGLGYKELYGYLDGACTLEQAVAVIKQNTRRFAKRQWTWFNRDKRIQWLDATRPLATLAEEVTNKISEFYTV